MLAVLKLSLILILSSTISQHVELTVGPHTFRYTEYPNVEVNPGQTSPRLLAATTDWCQALSSGLTVPVEQCAASMGSMATMELLKMRAANSESMDGLDHDSDGPEDVCGHDESCPADNQSLVVFNCMVPIPFEGSMDIMGYIDFLQSDTPATALERMRQDLNIMYGETILGKRAAAKLVGQDLEKAASLCHPQKKACRFTGSEFKKITCYRGRRSHLLSKHWWAELGKEFGLNITDGIPEADHTIKLSRKRIDRVRDGIVKFGFARIPAKELKLNDVHSYSGQGLVARLRKMMEKLHRLRLPPTCILVYDDAWRLFHNSMHGFMSELLGGPIEVRDIGATLYAITQASNATREVDLYTSNAGHAAHRDSGDHLGPPSREALGELNSWVPLTDHEPPGASLYVVPLHLDPMVNLPGSPSVVEKFRDPAPKRPQDGLFNKKLSFDLQSVRAVPAKAGDLVLWDGRLFHWASSADHAEGLYSRIAMSFYSSEAFPPQRKRTGPQTLRNFPKLPWNARLALLCGQLFSHIRLYPALFDFIAKHFKLCPKREHDGALWDPIRNFPHYKQMYEQLRQWEPHNGHIGAL